jgi:hypothetical protein
MHTLTRIVSALFKNLSAMIENLFIEFGDGPTVAASPALIIVSCKLSDNSARAGLNDKSY